MESFTMGFSQVFGLMLKGMLSYVLIVFLFFVFVVVCCVLWEVFKKLKDYKETKCWKHNLILKDTIGMVYECSKCGTRYSIINNKIRKLK